MEILHAWQEYEEFVPLLRKETDFFSSQVSIFSVLRIFKCLKFFFFLFFKPNPLLPSFHLFGDLDM